MYETTKCFPQSELYGLAAQIRRCCISIPSNIAEGNARGHTIEYKRFLQIAFGSGAELETQLLLAKRLGYVNDSDYSKLNADLEEIMKMLNKLIKNLRPSP